MNIAEILPTLSASLGDHAVLVGADIGERYLNDVLGNRGEAPLAVLRPRSTEQVSRALAICHSAGARVVVQGGRTGLALGQLPRAGEIVLSLELMNRIEAIDVDAATATVQAGVVLQTLQEAVDAQGLMFPLDLGGRGSCTIGGNIATNAGGNRVIRYGMTRELVVGLEAVLADGTVLSNLQTVTKNNTGPDLKQLFIGSEGVFGVVTRAVLRLSPKPADRIVALCALADFAQVRALLRHCRAHLAGELTAFEVLWSSYFKRALTLIDKTPPIRVDGAYYVLVEASGVDVATLQANVERTLNNALEHGLVTDVVLAKSGAEIERLWHMRDMAIDVCRVIDPIVPFDVSVNIADMEAFAADVERAVRAIDPRCDVIVFGHVGDGNLHLAVHQPPERPEVFDLIEQAVYELVGAYRGSVSAEHGIGWLKRDYLKHSRSPPEIQTMRLLKNALDPKHILNRHRIFPS